MNSRKNDWASRKLAVAVFQFVIVHGTATLLLLKGLITGEIWKEVALACLFITISTYAGGNLADKWIAAKKSDGNG